MPCFKSTKQPKPAIIALLGLGGPERSVFIEQVTGIIPGYRNKANLSTTRIFKSQFNDRELWLLDTPTARIPVAEIVGSITAAMARESGQSHSHTVHGIVYLYDITDVDGVLSGNENLEVFQALLKSARRENVVVVTTFWDLLRTPDEGVRTEVELRKVYDHIACLCRVQDSSDGQSYRVIIWDLVGRVVGLYRADGLDDDPAEPTIEELFNVVKDKDNKVACLETELQTTREASVRQLRDVQQKATEEQTYLYQQLQVALREISQLKEDLSRSQKSCVDEIRNLREQLDFERRCSNNKLRGLETQRSSLTGCVDDELCQDMITARSSMRKPPPPIHCSSELTSKLNTLDANGEFPLYNAAAGGCYDDVKRLLKQGANPSMRTRFQWTALHWAVENGHARVVQLLLDHGADINAVSDTGCTPLSMARTDMMKGILRQRGAK
ncbi:hypothetical protein ETB97_009660 [Aspergillus alliaceus]|uniref:Uncharacterized protein n=1 Tax=Petromyces alliaceus TaxID=209559 RepID=A0A8H5ZVR9_PETAA|nr:hypothetical protein ETB97_009660 [Aspergillus burnettii]